MSCPCQCCKERKACAHVLVLSAKDNSDASRLWQRFIDSPPGYVNLKAAPQEQRAKREAAEPTEPVTCRSCGKSHAVLVYLMQFVREQRAPLPKCPDCAPKVTPPIATSSPAQSGMWGHR